MRWGVIVTGTAVGAASENLMPVRSILVDGPGTWRRLSSSMNRAARMRTALDRTGRTAGFRRPVVSEIETWGRQNATGVPGRRCADNAVPSAAVPSLSEAESKRLLAGFGIPFADDRLATTPEDAVAAADGVGYPAVAKLCGPGIAHKTER